MQLDETRTAAVFKKLHFSANPAPQPTINKKDFCSWRCPQLVLAKHREAKKKKKRDRCKVRLRLQNSPGDKVGGKGCLSKARELLQGALLVPWWYTYATALLSLLPATQCKSMYSLFCFLSGTKDGQAERCWIIPEFLITEVVFDHMIQLQRRPRVVTAMPRLECGRVAAQYSTLASPVSIGTGLTVLPTVISWFRLLRSYK